MDSTVKVSLDTPPVDWLRSTTSVSLQTRATTVWQRARGLVQNKTLFTDDQERYLVMMGDIEVGA